MASTPTPFGTFTRDVPRAGSQFDAARRKAQLAIELGGVAQGLCLHAHDVVASHDQLRAFAARAGFPEHGLVMRLSEDGPIATNSSISGSMSEFGIIPAPGSIALLGAAGLVGSRRRR